MRISQEEVLKQCGRLPWWSGIHLPMQEMQVLFLGQEGALEKKMTIPSSILA